MSEKKVSNVSIAGAQLIFKNFRGKKTDYNEEGNRNFGVLIDEDLAEKLEQDGWRVRRLRPKDDDPEQFEQPWLSVKVRFDPYPPIAVLINSRGRKTLSEDTIDQLDWSRIKNCDLIIRPYQYPPSNFSPEGGVAAYLKAIYVTIDEDEFEAKYANLPNLDGEMDE